MDTCRRHVEVNVLLHDVPLLPKLCHCVHLVAGQGVQPLLEHVLNVILKIIVLLFQADLFEHRDLTIVGFAVDLDNDHVFWLNFPVDPCPSRSEHI